VALAVVKSVRDPKSQRAYYFPKCRLCGRPKGRSNRPLCPSCGHRVPRMDGGDWPIWRRDSAIVSLYFSGVRAETLGKAFSLTKRRILQIISEWK
jgi:predicted amidophosphoribosyltransferase